MIESSADLKLVLIEESVSWEKYLDLFPEANFLQSWNWGEFQRSLGKKTFAMAFFRAAGDQLDKPEMVALAVLESAKRGRYLTIAGGPLGPWASSQELNQVFQLIKQLAIQHHCDFIRIRPQILDSVTSEQLSTEVGLRRSPMHLTADLTWQLDLRKSDEELLSSMRKSTRYEIRRSQKLGVVVETSTKVADITEFYRQQLWVANRHGFIPFSEEFLRQQFQVFVKSDQARLFHATLDGKLLASAFILLYRGEAVYHYGISTPDNHKLPGAYACQWAAINWAKTAGATRYNFWGIAPENQPHHRFAGVTLFKTGFGGNAVAYLPAHDLPITFNYQLVRLFEWWRKQRRHL